jgi:hypothetical protein
LVAPEDGDAVSPTRATRRGEDGLADAAEPVPLAVATCTLFLVAFSAVLRPRTLGFGWYDFLFHTSGSQGPRPLRLILPSGPRATAAVKTLPIGRGVGPADVVALAVHIMGDTALRRTTYDIDGGQQLVP